MIISDAKRNDLALMALLIFGCTCAGSKKELAVARSYFAKEPDWVRRPILMAVATHHFRKCVYEKSLLIRQKNGVLVFQPGGRK